jgi:D-aspartate ligase
MTQLDTSTPAVIFKLDRNVMHHGGLGAIRSLGRLGVPVYGVHEDPLAPAASSRYLHGRWMWQPPADDAERVRAGLITLAQRIGRRAVLIPTDDAGAIFLAEHGTDLRRDFLFPDPPAGLPRRLAGKYPLYQLCRELGVPCVAATLPTSAADAQDFAHQVGFPLVAKLATPWQRSGLRSTWVVHTREDLLRACAGRHGTALMLHEYIPHQAGQDYFFHGYCDARSRCQPAFVGIKERSYPAHAGLTSLGRWVDNAALRYRSDSLDLKSWVASVRRVDELAWFARDDLAPFGLMCLRMGWRAMTRYRAGRSALAPMTTQPPARKALT